MAFINDASVLGRKGDNSVILGASRNGFQKASFSNDLCAAKLIF